MGEDKKEWDAKVAADTWWRVLDLDVTVEEVSNIVELLEEAYAAGQASVTRERDEALRILKAHQEGKRLEKLFSVSEIDLGNEVVRLQAEIARLKAAAKPEVL